MKKYTCMILSAILLMSMMIVPSVAEEAYQYIELDEGPFKHLELSDGTVELSSNATHAYALNQGWVTPQYINGKLVSVIGKMELLPDYLVISEGVTTVKDDAFFFHAERLCDIMLPSTLEYIGARAFKGPVDYGMTYDESDYPHHIIIPPSVTYMGEYCVGYSIYFGLGGSEHTPDPIDDFTIYGTAGTVAEQYAEDNGFAFVDMATFVPCGNVTLDEEVNMEDAFMMYKAASGDSYATSAVLLEGDLDGNGRVDMKDTFALYMTVSGG